VLRAVFADENLLVGEGVAALLAQVEDILLVTRSSILSP
jgi:hypothetical protein